MKAIVVFAFLIMAVAGMEPNCRDIFSAKSCCIAKGRNECAKNSTISRVYCQLTCNTCSSISSCDKSVPLGMESKAIPDSKITASSAWAWYDARFARLNGYAGGGWGPKKNSDKEWLQVDLSDAHVVTGIATQGSAQSSQWTTSYTIQYTLDGSMFIDYQSGQVMTGNKDPITVVKHDLRQFVARYIRLIPKSWHSWVVIRMELYGCKKA